MCKVLIIDLHCDALLPSGVEEFGGGNTYSNSLLKVLIDSDINILYVTRKKVDSLPETEIISDNVLFHRIELNIDVVNDKDVLHYHSDDAFNKIKSLINQLSFHPDIIHSIYWPSGIIAEKLGALYNIPFIHTILSNGKRKQLESGVYDIAEERIQYENRCFNSADYLICCSTSELNDIHKLYNIPKNKLVLTGLSVDKSFIYPAYDKLGQYRINSIIKEDSPQYISPEVTKDFNYNYWWNTGAFLYYGRLHEDKGVHIIIDSWLELYKSYNDFPSLWIAGGTAEQINYLRKKIANADILKKAEKEQKLVWWGRLPAEGLSTLLLKCTALVTHSKYETGGLMVIEAMSQGIPVIATPFGYANDYIENWKTGFLVKYNDIKSLKLKMYFFYKQPFLSGYMGSNCKKISKKLYKYFDFKNKHIALYKNKYGNHTKIICDIDLIIKDEGSEYPVSEYSPTQEDIIKWFAQKKKSNCFNVNNNIRVVKCSEYMECTVWKIRQDETQYECFRWKSHINIDKLFNEKESYVYYSKEMMRVADKLISIGVLCCPFSYDMDKQLIIHEITNDDIDLSNHTNALIKLFHSVKSISCDKIPTIEFNEFIDNQLNMLPLLKGKSIGININNISCQIKPLFDQFEPQGIVPIDLKSYNVISKGIRCINGLSISTISYSFAKLFLALNSTPELIQYNIKPFLELSEISYKKNTLLWIISIYIYDYIKSSIIDKDPCIFEVEKMILYLIKLLEEYI